MTAKRMTPEEARESFGHALEGLRSEKRFRDWLQAQRSMYRYSPHNTLWILFQNPWATYVASYKRWKEELGYQVRRNEISLKVWAPRNRKVVEVDPETQEEVEVVRVTFSLGSVFDVSQVDPIPGKAKPLTLPQPGPADGDSHEWALGPLEAYAQQIGCEVKREALPNGQSGYQDRKTGAIGLDRDLAPNGQVQVLIHEEAHALGIDYEQFGRARAEAIVECAAFIVCARIGLDVSESAVPYVASWVKEDFGVIERDAKAIDRIAKAILKGADLESAEPRRAQLAAAA
jgi:hypothetical protein